MNNYNKNLSEIKRDIISQKTIYKFRNFLYSINKDVRRNFFDISKKYLDNEYNYNTEITVTEKERLNLLINHWEWNNFESYSTNWWFILTVNHSHSITLMELIHLWIDDIDIFDSDAFETSTFGLR